MTDAAPELQRARQWSSALAAALDEVAGQVEAAARSLADGWPDARGAEWADRLRRLRRAVDRDAADARDLGHAIDRVADAVGGPPVGPQLGSTAGRHVDDRRGVTVPELGDPFAG